MAASSTSQPTQPSPRSYDYIIVGGGVAGLTLASRLSKLLSSANSDNADTTSPNINTNTNTAKRILVLEAGTDPSQTDYIVSATGYNQAKESEYAYILDVEPNPHLNGRSGKVSVGKALGGSGAINGSAWTRGPKADYDYWAKLVGDDDWSYDKLLPFFQRLEHIVENSTEQQRDELHHGYDGIFKVVPIRANHPKRHYPLRETIQKAWEEAGVPYKPDGNNGNQNGLTEMVELWVDGKRQLPSQVLDLSRVEIRLSTRVRRVILDTSVAGEPVATGVELVSGERLPANKEVILCAGVYHSPQILMLSGIGDLAVLQQHGIQTIVPNVEVGKNLVDHLAIGMTWKLKHPEKGLAFGSPLLTDPSYFAGWPLDFMEFGQLDEPDKLVPLIKSAEERDFLLRPGTSHMEIVTLYAPMGAKFVGIDAAMDGSHLSSIAVCLATTSKGSVTIRSANPEDPPVIDTNSNATETDRYISREALRKVASVYLETETGKSLISHEVTPPGYAAITHDTPDGEIDKRIRDFGYSLDHPMGTCSMGKVVDSHCRVKGVKGLRVVDGSVIPLPLACHIQVAVYAIAERVAEWVARGE
ncbi:hypothetical protein HRR83_003985 [Exophiala dermatitidis]|uniref:Choline dehydrogenase n=2 Tax=Exophiala dermatitidis TaxID=5970 RepID=H6BQA1_EXODN|nr:choline dehydrogenase [Exophiala dermatitidis NIH/UT8656]KAJ4522049.1 hypothetical protein HRR74_002628 [Exophiala dermatitidis]EHY53771.1 choline dehydrogenase [Exophiala dermatitidis NIH/UT8656]KAJ4529375.1 hypothetical protein HRR73_000398 [Exophiala dermatitidis]KAJ4543969.1 hypothetical protein HRR76_002029 [Exophiala dermatitidis]KAJ4549144.1 hypothetical protein HRR77_004022 [Exophiala dermatitidis]